MSKNKNLVESATESLTQGAMNVGVGMMAVAAVMGVVGHERGGKEALVPSQPVFAFAEETPGSNENNAIRREKGSEETGAHYVSYSNVQRTPARSGKL